MGISDVGAASDQLNSSSGVALLNTLPFPPARDVMSVPGIVPWSDQIRSDQSLSRVRLFVTPWTAACQVPLPMGFPRHEYWGGLPFPTPGDQTCISSAGRWILYIEPPGEPQFRRSQVF